MAIRLRLLQAPDPWVISIVQRLDETAVGRRRHRGLLRGETAHNIPEHNS